MVSYGASPGRHAVLVDAGYLYASAGRLVLGRDSRRDFRVAAEPLIAALLARAAARSPGELLRMYWYDAARDRVPTVEQRQIAALPHVKVRLGTLNASGEQKGVDAQLRADLELLARHRAVCDVILVTGDEDILPAVEAAQAYGVRVHVWGVEPTYGENQAERLIWEADTVERLDAGFCGPFLSAEPEGAGLAGAASGGARAASSGAGAVGVATAGAGSSGAQVSGDAASGSGSASGGAAPVSVSVPGAGGVAAGGAAVGGVVRAGAAASAAGPPGAGVDGVSGSAAGGSIAAGSAAGAPAGGSVEEQAAADAARASLVPTPAEVFRGRKAAPPPPPVTATTVASFGPGPTGYGLALPGSGPHHGHPTHPAGPGPDRPADHRPGPERPEMEQVGARIAARWLITRGRDNVADLLPGPVLPTVIDKELLVEAEEEISRSLRPYEEARRALRDGFWARLHTEFGIAVPPAGSSGPPAGQSGLPAAANGGPTPAAGTNPAAARPASAAGAAPAAGNAPAAGTASAAGSTPAARPAPAAGNAPAVGTAPARNAPTGPAAGPATPKPPVPTARPNPTAAHA